MDTNKGMHWYKRDARAALMGLMGLSSNARLLYSVIVDLYYLKIGPLPEDDNFIRGFTAMSGQAHHAAKKELVAKGKIEIRDGFIFDDRGDLEVESWKTKSRNSRGVTKDDDEKAARSRRDVAKKTKGSEGEDEEKTKGSGNDVDEMSDGATNENNDIPTNGNSGLTRAREEGEEEENRTTLEANASSSAPAQTSPSKKVVPKSLMTPEHLVQRWNDIADWYGWPKVRQLTDARRKAANRMLGKHNDNDWNLLFEELGRARFFQHEDGYRVTFDFLMKEANFVKVIEGNYRHAPKRGGRTESAGIAALAQQLMENPDHE